MNRFLIAGIVSMLLASFFICGTNASSAADDSNVTVSNNGSEKRQTSNKCTFCEHRNFGGWCFDVYGGNSEAALGNKWLVGAWRNTNNRISSISCQVNTKLRVYDLENFQGPWFGKRQCGQSLTINDLSNWVYTDSNGYSYPPNTWNDKASSLIVEDVDINECVDQTQPW